MGKPTGFLEIQRKDRGYAKPGERVKSYKEFTKRMPEGEVREQAARCMDCGIPFCHNGCPVNNQIPDWNSLVHRDQWRAALDNLHSTNNFPEFTGRICPAPCEAACVLNIDENPVTIKTIECEIVDRGWDEGWIKPLSSARGTGKRIAIVGSGPAGLACAQQLARAGHAPTVFVGGLLRYGIPDFKMEKRLIDRRVKQMEAEGVIFRTGMYVGIDVTVQRILDDYQVLVLAGGAEQPRDLVVPGRELDGVHFAMDFLTQRSQRLAERSQRKASMWW
jgi:glutamate synthase (NADPH/NADH) small chain